jgi:N-acetylmuramoyl-L-alanine amidase
MKIALVVGHSEKAQGAANSDSRITEFQYNKKLVAQTQEKLQNMGIEAVIIYRDTYKGLPGKINKENPDLIVSFHCNACNKKASGSETLFLLRSKNGKILADELQKYVVSVLELPNRGAKPRTIDDRGGFLLKYTKAPCVILEPFFIDNNSDLKKAQKLQEELASSISMAIIKTGKKTGKFEEVTECQDQKNNLQEISKLSVKSESDTNETESSQKLSPELRDIEG